MRTATPLIVLGCLLLLGGCAGRKAPPSANGASMSLTPEPAAPVLRFSGRFSPTGNLAGGVITTNPPRIVGTVRLMSAPGSDDEYTVQFEFTSERGAEELQWSVVPGRCGGGAFPVTPPEQLTPVDVPTSGSVRISRRFIGTLTPGLDYHLNLYANGGSDLASVVGCANLQD